MSTTRRSRLPDQLADAHAWLIPHYPYDSSSREAWREWYELQAEVFSHIAETDKDHHYEAVALAGISRRHAEQAGAGANAGPENRFTPPPTANTTPDAVSD
ncbi:MAG: hypothetical protein JOZ47_13940 [Kutzneria sp.]|nr:hypothetical protein [Kutzneria sp.]MBV9846155.1 hypothetical protein [Kutzneria sp.]